MQVKSDADERQPLKYESPFLGPVGVDKLDFEDEDQELDGGDKKKKSFFNFSRTLPVALDITIFLMQLVIFVGYLYMTFFYGELNSIHCRATAEMDVPLSSISSL